MIVYKVVDRNTRYGSNYIVYTNKYNKIKELHEKFKGLLQKYPKLKEYFPQYKEGEVIQCVKGSVGLMSLETKEDAKNFIEVSGFNKERVSIIKCEAYGILKTSKVIGKCGIEPERLLLHYSIRDKTYLCREVVFSKELKVLE
jgi:hypothetical protein